MGWDAIERVVFMRSVNEKRKLSIQYNKLGDIAKQEGNLDSARQYYEDALKIREDIAWEADDLVNAKKYYEKSFDIIEKLSKTIKTTQISNRLAITYERFGNIEYAKGDLFLANYYYEIYFTTSKEIAEETKEEYAYRNLSISYERLGDIALETGDILHAEKYYEKSLKISEQLVTKTESRESLSDLADCYLKMHFAKEDNIEWIKKSYDIYKKRAKCYPEIKRYTNNFNIIKKNIKTDF